MDKETLSHYGWIVILVLILAVMLAFATPFGNFIAGGVNSAIGGFFGVNQNALGAAGIGIGDQEIELPGDPNFKRPGAGLYDADDKLLADWETLTGTYGFNISKNQGYSGHKTSKSSMYYLLNNYEELSTGVKLVIDDSVTAIGEYTFANCPQLTTIHLPSSLQKTSHGSFAYSENIKHVYITDLESFCTANYGTTSLTDSGTSVGGSRSGSTLPEGYNLYLNGEMVTELTLPSSITTIGTMAFSGCASIENLTIPSTVTNIGDYAFQKMLNVKTIKLDAVNVMNGCFSNAEMETLIIGKNVENMGFFVFDRCPNLKKVSFEEGGKLTRIYKSSFTNCN